MKKFVLSIALILLFISTSALAPIAVQDSWLASDTYDEFITNVYTSLHPTFSDDLIDLAEQIASRYWPDQNFCFDLVEEAYYKAYNDVEKNFPSYGPLITRPGYALSTELENARTLAQKMEINPSDFEKKLVEKFYADLIDTMKGVLSSIGLSIPKDEFQKIRPEEHVVLTQPCIDADLPIEQCSPLHNILMYNEITNREFYKIADYAIEIARDNYIEKDLYNLRLLKEAWENIDEITRPNCPLIAMEHERCLTEHLNSRLSYQKLAILTEETKRELGYVHNDPTEYDRIVLDFMKKRKDLTLQIEAHYCPAIPDFWAPTNRRCAELYVIVQRLAEWNVYSYVVKEGDNPSKIAFDYLFRGCSDFRYVGYDKISTSPDIIETPETIYPNETVYIFVAR